MNSRVDVGPPAEPPSRSAAPPAGESPSVPLPPAPSPTTVPRRDGQMTRRVARVVRTGALFVVGGALLVYIAVWALLFAVLTLGSLGLLAYTAVLGAILAIIVPLLLVRYGAEVRRPLAAIGRWIGGRAHAGGAVAQPAPGASETSWRQRVLRLLGIHAVWSRTARLWALLGLGVALALIWSFAVLLFQVASGGRCHRHRPARAQPRRAPAHPHARSGHVRADVSGKHPHGDRGDGGGYLHRPARPPLRRCPVDSGRADCRRPLRRES